MANEVGDVFRVVAQFDPANAGAEVQNIYHFRLDALVSDTDNDILADFIARIDLIMNQVGAYFSSNYNGVSCRVTNSTKRERVGQGALTFVGADVSTDELPAQSSAEILFPLKELGRTGRKYLGPLTEASQVGTVLVAGAVTALNAAAALIADAAWPGATSTNTYATGVARYAGKVLTDFTPFGDGVADIVADLRIQNRRRPGRGLS